MASCSIEGVAGYEIPVVWPKIHDMVVEAMDKAKVTDYYGLDDVFRMISLKEMQLWICVSKRQIKAFAMTKIVKYPKRQVIDIFLTGGRDMDEWVQELWQTLKEYGKNNRCEEIRAFGRKGWTRVLPDDINYSGSWSAKLTL